MVLLVSSGLLALLVVARLLLLLQLLSSSLVVSPACGWVLFPVGGAPSRSTPPYYYYASWQQQPQRPPAMRRVVPTMPALFSTAKSSAAVAVPKYCSDCGSNQMIVSVPQNDTRERAVCNDCGRVVYANPKIVVACVILDASQPQRCLLGQRAIAPRAGYWGFPQGFLEEGETTREAAVREVYEEFQLRLPEEPSALKLRAIYNVVPGSVQIVYEARVDATATTTIIPSTLECQAIAWFPRDQLPELCFPTVQWALDHCWSIMSSNNTHNNRIQQKTKTFDAALDRWIALEDEPLGDATNFSA
jgi:ADP-ribose pyrophosphatase YjhB (NUDIX family)